MHDASPPTEPKSIPHPIKSARVGLRSRLSRFRALLSTACGNPAGFFVQYPYIKHLQPVSTPYPEVEALCEASGFRDVLSEIWSHRETLSGFGEGANDPTLGRGMFPALDGMAAYAIVRKQRPNRIVEIGSGDSTFILARGVRDNGFGQITCIDPGPRRSINELGVDLKRRLMTVDDVDLASSLEPNDILFIDSSHICMPGMDVDIQFNRMFPRLKRGVIVHIHDVFLPDDYPDGWRQRGYSEQNALIGWLVTGWFEIIWPSRYVLTRYRPMVEATIGGIAPMPVGGSLWLRRL